MDGVKFTSVVVALLFYSTVFSQFGVLDPSFGDNGKVTTVFGTGNSLMYALDIQSDGKIIAGGAFEFEGLRRLAFARYNLDGSLDASFGTEGKSVITSFGIGLNPFSMKIQTDGKIVVACNSYNESLSRHDYHLVRLNNNGSLDLSFGTQGLVTVPNGTFVSVIKSFALHPNGKITAVGYVEDAGIFAEILLIQFNFDGSLDDSFGTDGTINVNFRVFDRAKAIEVLSDGKILIAGNSSENWNEENGYDYDFVVARLNADGELDTTFGVSGKAFVGILEENDNLLYMNILSDGKITIAGYLGYPASFGQIRLLSTGVLDADFGTDGIVQTEIPTTDVMAIKSQQDGKLVLSGSYGVGACCSQIRLIRLMDDGGLDTTFGVNGVVEHTSEAGQGRDLLFQQDGKIVVAGGGGNGNPVHTDFNLYRYTSGLYLSATDFNSDAKISVYPNPIKDMLNIDFKLTEDSNINIDLFDFSGRKVEILLDKQQITSGNHSFNFQLPNTMSKGVYFLNIMNKSERKIVKLVK